MRCPKCKKEGCRYIVLRQRTESKPRVPVQRTDFTAVHSCGFRGEVL